MRPALAHARHNPCLLQDAQVLRDRGLRDAEAASGLSHRRRAGAESFDDAPADRVRQSLERIVNHTVNGITGTTGGAPARKRNTRREPGPPVLGRALPRLAGPWFASPLPPKTS